MRTGANSSRAAGDLPLALTHHLRGLRLFAIK